MNFVNALEKIPGIIAQYEERTAKLKADVPILEGIMAKTWGKEDEKDGEEVNPDIQQPSKVVEAPSQTADDKNSMVAEPKPEYTTIFNRRKLA